jgi:hypothetical protein
MQPESENGTPGGVVDASGGIFSDEEFQERVRVVMNAIHPDNDPDGEKNRRCIAEIHTYLSLFDKGIREMQSEMAMMGGPFGLMKKMFRS